MMRLDPIDKLARRICWLGFFNAEGREGKTEATYWASLPKETHERYRREAMLLVIDLRALRKTASSQDILGEALRYRGPR